MTFKDQMIKCDIQILDITFYHGKSLTSALYRTVSVAVNGSFIFFEEFKLNL